MKKISIINQGIDQRYTDLFRSFYENETNIDYFLSDLKLGIDYCLNKKCVTTVSLLDTEQNILLGHCSIIMSEGSNESAHFGFFELQNNEDFELLWSSVTGEAKKQNVKKLTGPINGSIYFPYRFINTSDGSNLFKGELPTKFFYSKLFSDIKDGKSVSFVSGVRKNFDFIIEATRKSYESLINADFKVEILHHVTNETLQEIQNLAESIFLGQSVAYESIPLDYFLEIYNKDKMGELFGLYIFKKDEKIIGFCSLFYEDKNKIIFKTLAVHPLFQKHGIGSALSYLAHMDAKKLGIKEIIYALIREGNNIKYFPQDDVSIIRTYSVFEFNI